MTLSTLHTYYEPRQEYKQQQDQSGYILTVTLYFNSAKISAFSNLYLVKTIILNFLCSRCHFVYQV